MEPELVTAGYLPEKQPAVQPAPSSPRIEIVTTPSVLDYSDSWAGFRLTPERVAWNLRQADWGFPVYMVDMFESVTLNDGHLRGLFEQRMDEVAAVPWTLRAGDERPASTEVADKLTAALQDVDIAGLIEFVMLGTFYGYSYIEVAWQQRSDGVTVPVEFVCVPHRRFQYDIDGRVFLSSEANPYPGVPLQRTAGSSWVTATQKRWRKPTQAGILRTAVYWAVFKRMSVRDWLIFAEKFGIPFILGKYAENSSEVTRKALKEAIASLGTEGRAIVADGQIIEILDKTLRSGGGDHLHQGITSLCNSEISKVITAATLTSDTGGPGSFALGKVHEDQKHKLSLADARRVGAIFQRDIGREFLARNGLQDKAAAPWLHVHVQKLSLLTDSQVLTNLVEAGLPISISQLREKFEYRAPSSDDDTLKPVVTRDATNVDPANPNEPSDPAAG